MFIDGLRYRAISTQFRWIFEMFYIFVGFEMAIFV